MTLFSPERFSAALHTRDIGRRLVYRETVETTMTIARDEHERGCAHGTLVLAEEQTAGRGRRGRAFQSPAGENLYFTLVLRLLLPEHRRLPVVAPLAVARACGAMGADVRIKWPNDLWVGERKLCGMLIDADLGGSAPVAYPGIGINVNGDPTVIPELRDIATSLRRELGHAVNREALLARICNEFEAWLAAPPDDLIAAYRELSMVLGRGVRIQPAGGEPYDAIATAIAEDGSLVVERHEGALETVTAADVSLRPRT